MAKSIERSVRMDSELYYGADTSGCPIECLPDLIRKRAYQLFEARGRQPGHELDDWLQAELETNQHLGFKPLP
jgi:hypothetical protein